MSLQQKRIDSPRHGPYFCHLREADGTLPGYPLAMQGHIETLVPGSRGVGVAGPCHCTSGLGFRV